MTPAVLSECAICGAAQWLSLPDPGPQSMTSDWRIVSQPLGREMCSVCGLVVRRERDSIDSIYSAGYHLYAHAPGESRERARQGLYAEWITASTTRVPSRVLDVGCGNGSLLRALRASWPQAALLGCDPSEESISHGAGDGLRLWQGTADDLPDDVDADLITTVNVIEHTKDPLAFLLALRRSLAHDGHLVVVCPNGGRPGLDLLFADHVFSFAPEHLRALVSRAGFDVAAQSTAPASLGPFQMVVGRPTDSPSKPPVFERPHSEMHVEYLERWRRLDDSLLARTGIPAVCFGAGEAAGLLRAYAPRTWRNVSACTVDGDVGGTFGELPMIAVDDVPPAATVLLGVRPLDQPRLADRLRARFSRVVTWYDLVDGEQRA